MGRQSEAATVVAPEVVAMARARAAVMGEDATAEAARVVAERAAVVMATAVVGKVVAVPAMVMEAGCS
jgi:hypothetical protein